MKYLFLSWLLFTANIDNCSYYFEHGNVGWSVLKIDSNNNTYFYFSKTGMLFSLSFGDIRKIDINKYVLNSYNQLPVVFISKNDIALKKKSKVYLNLNISKEECDFIDKIGVVINGQDISLKHNKFITKKIYYNGIIRNISLYYKVNNSVFRSRVYLNKGSSNSILIRHKYDNDLSVFYDYSNDTLDLFCNNDSLKWSCKSCEMTYFFHKVDKDSINEEFKSVVNPYFFNKDNMFLEKSQ
jgi:hypothetical protein